MIEQLEKQLDDFDPAQRAAALARLAAMAQAGEVGLPVPGKAVNLHFHTFFSYNACGYSPSKLAWLARKQGLALAGTVDFDVLDALDEFRDACKLLDLKGCSGLETRVFVPEFADREINSPGEPGISYHMGVGFPSSQLAGPDAEFLKSLRQTVAQRNRDLLTRVNRYLSEIALDYQADVLPLTPNGNATERHICAAYARKAQAVFSDPARLAAYWSEKLATPAAELDLPDSAKLHNTLRSKTMKQGGVGYVQPGSGSFPGLAETNRFLLNAGAIPTHTWLNGLSAGEQAIEELLDVGMSTGVAALNIIPDRNYTPGVQDEKLAKLYEVVDIAQRRHLPVVVGTEMNSPGQKFVDSFDTAELRPLLPIFLKGAYIVYAHSALQRAAGLGYVSPWALKTFPDVASRNDFFEQVGRRLRPGQHDSLAACDDNCSPAAILERLEA